MKGATLGRPLVFELIKEVRRLHDAFQEMPAVDIAFGTEKEMDDWNLWKAKYFNRNGQLKGDME